MKKINFTIENGITDIEEFLRDNDLHLKDYEKVFIYKTGLKNIDLYHPHGETKKDNVLEVQILFAESDEGNSIQQQIEIYESTGLPCPSKILYSGNKSLHFYIPIQTTSDTSRWELAQHLFAAAIKGDQCMAQLNRALRKPGILHHKSGKMSVFQRYNYDVHDIDDIIAILISAVGPDAYQHWYEHVYNKHKPIAMAPTINSDTDPERAMDIFEKLISTVTLSHKEACRACYSAHLNKLTDAEIHITLQSNEYDQSKIDDLLRAVRNDGFTQTYRGTMYKMAKEAEIDISIKKNTKDKEDKLLSPFETIDKLFGYKRNLADEFVYDKYGKIAEGVERLKVKLDRMGQKVIDRNGKPAFLGKSDAFDYALEVAEANAYNPILDQVDYFKKKLRSGDYIKMNVDALATQWINPDATEFENILFKTWLIGTMKRIVEPGCKMHLVLVLFGDQGTGKSSFLEILSRGFFQDGCDVDSSGDEIRKRRAAWICELSELNHTKREAGAVKAYISASFDAWTPKYSNMRTKKERYYTFAGTTNDQIFLNDHTGSRRFGIVRMPKRYTNQDLLKEQVDDLWCNILDPVLKGASTELPSDWTEMQKIINSEYTTEDSFLESITNYLAENEGAKGFTTDQIWLEALDGRKGGASDGDKSKIIKILKAKGYKKKSIRIGGKPVSAWTDK